MTTGRINQVTFLSEREHVHTPTVWYSVPRSHKGAEASWRGLFDKRVRFLSLVFLLLAAGLFGFSETSTTFSIVQSSIAKGYNQTRGFPKETRFL